jgi:transcriptional regulator with XRE-family HTH domain
MRKDLVKLGSAIKLSRKEQGLTLKELSEKTELTPGLLSKIENFRTIPSLPVLVKIADALNVQPSKFLEGIGGDSQQNWIRVKKEERTVVEREDNTGFIYETLLDTDCAGINLQAMVVTIQSESNRERVTTEGDQFILMLKGAIDFWLDHEKVELSEGDFLFFDGNIEHVPQNPTQEPAVLLAVYLLKDSK